MKNNIWKINTNMELSNKFILKIDHFIEVLSLRVKKYNEDLVDIKRLIDWLNNEWKFVSVPNENEYYQKLGTYNWKITITENILDDFIELKENYNIDKDFFNEKFLWYIDQLKRKEVRNLNFIIDEEKDLNKFTKHWFKKYWYFKWYHSWIKDILEAINKL